MQLSIIIVNYNVKYFVELAVSSAIEASNDIEAEIIVVDNNSSDNSVEYLKAKFPDVQIIANKKNTGFAVANNQAIKIAKGEFVLLLNPDTIVAGDTLTKCLSFMNTHGNAGAIGVKMIDGSGSFLPESKRAFPGPLVAFYKAFGLSALFPKSKSFGKYHLGYLNDDETHKIDVLAGAFMFIRKSVLDDIGAFDESFFMYGEDIDLSYRIKKAGYDNYYYHEAPIIHFKGESTKKGTLNYVQMFYNAMKIFAKKHFSGRNKGVFIALINLAIYFRAFIALFTGFLKRFSFPLIDILIIFLSMFLIKEYWEYYVRYIDGGTYPLEYLYINIPLYILIWISAIYFSGGYDQTSNTTKIIRGMAWGTIIIAALYGFLPDQLRFSRGMILAGAALSTTIIILFRYIKHFLKHGDLKYGSNPQKRIVVIADEMEANHIHRILEKNGLGKNAIGYIGSQQKSGILPQLSEIEQLNNALEIYKPGELIFGLGSVEASMVIKLMNAHKHQFEYKMLSKGSDTIVGSSSKNETGELYIDDQYAISSPFNRRLKRFIDVTLALLLLISLPLQILLQQKRNAFVKNLIAVLKNKMTWVGYYNRGFQSGMPKLLPGVLFPLDGERFAINDSVDYKVINLLYAKEYNLAKDLKIILRNFRQLGGKQ